MVFFKDNAFLTVFNFILLNSLFRINRSTAKRNIYCIILSEIPGFIDWIKIISSQAVILTMWNIKNVKITNECVKIYNKHVHKIQCCWWWICNSFHYEKCLTRKTNLIFNIKTPEILYMYISKLTLLLFGINNIVLKQIMYRLMHVFAPVPIWLCVKLSIT